LALAVLACLLAQKNVKAGCGDYDMPLPVVADPVSEMFSLGSNHGADHGKKGPCRGPNCTKQSPPFMPPAPAPTSVSSTNSDMLFMLNRPPESRGESALRGPESNTFLSDNSLSIFHPPRI